LPIGSAPTPKKLFTPLGFYYRIGASGGFWRRLRALDAFRTGAMGLGLAFMDGSTDEADPDATFSSPLNAVVTPYRADKSQFKADMRAIASLALSHRF
jgi:hypothetical protein